MEGFVHSMETFGLVDGPGVRFVVFLQGCRMRCRYCHNPETWKLEGGTPWTADKLFSHVYRYKSYWNKKGQPNGGITVSGGEPLLQIDFVTEFFKKAKEKGVHTALDTAGNPFTLEEPFISKFEELMKVTDLVILDFKEIDNEKHKKLTGCPNDNIVQMAKWLSDHGKDMWLRHVLVPDLTDDEDYEETPAGKKSDRKKKKKGPNSAVTIVALLAGAVVLVGAIFVIGKAAGIIGSDGAETTPQTEQAADTADEDGMVTVPVLVGKTEEEASALLEEEKLGKQMMGEENSTQEKGRISSQDIPAGTKVEQYTTLKYYISKGQQEITVPGVSGQTGVDAQQTLEDLGLTVTVQKEYSEADDSGWPLTEPGYVMAVSPEAGTSMTAGGSVTLTVSRGLDYGDTAQIPYVVGMTKNEAITTLGKWADIQITEQQSSEVPAGQVISQDPSATSEDGDTAYGNPDETISIVVSSGNQAPADTTTTTDTTTDSASTADTAQQSTAAANGEVWKCTQTLNTPNGYQGGAIRLELIQEVNGETTSTKVVDGEAITFPYTLDITGASGVSEGTLYVSELIDGNFQQLGSYPLTFKKAE